jgi:hypothetical protein
VAVAAVGAELLVQTASRKVSETSEKRIRDVAAAAAA